MSENGGKKNTETSEADAPQRNVIYKVESAGKIPAKGTPLWLRYG